MVLLGISDANLKFLYANIGVPGSNNDASIWNNCDFKQSFDCGNIQFPQVPRGSIPFHLLGDDAFGMTSSLMKPYPRSCSTLSKKEKVFNYRFSCGRRVVENAFGLLVSPVLCHCSSHHSPIITKCLRVHMLSSCRFDFSRGTSAIYIILVSSLNGTATTKIKIKFAIDHNGSVDM